jgi:UV DNA damage endonuclease
MRLGYACINSTIDTKFRSLRLKTFHKEGVSYLREVILHNLGLTYDILEWNVKNNIFFYRMSSDIMPLITHPDVTAVFDWSRDKEILEVLNDIKIYSVKNKIRLSMHPDQYTVLNSLKDNVVKRSIEYLVYHADVLDKVGGQDMIIHVGGVYGDKVASKKRFISKYNSLEPRIKGYIRLENDDKSYTLKDIIDIHNETGVKLVWDYHHHRCLNDLWPSKEEIDALVKSWQSSKVKVHISSGKTGAKDRSHADFIQIEDFVHLMELFKGFDIDVMIEAKAKEQALLKLRSDYETYYSNQ